jgi:hypothetical protein
MNCTSCGTAGVVVVRTYDEGKTVRRRRMCACGWTWSTKEIEERGSGALMHMDDKRQTALVIKPEGGDISLSESSSPPSSQSDAGACSEGRARKSPYSDEFEACWLTYGRKEEKVKAYARWKIEAKAAGGEAVLRDLVLKALAWQATAWARDGWKFAKYFERYLKARKWEDEPMPSVGGARRPATRGEATVENLGAWLAKGTGK